MVVVEVREYLTGVIPSIVVLIDKRLSKVPEAVAVKIYERFTFLVVSDAVVVEDKVR